MCFAKNKKRKKRFFEALSENHDIVMGYFGAADVIGHLSFGMKIKMKIIYKEMEDIVKNASEKADKLIVISDHGMEAIGRFGDHSDHGFWSTNFETDFTRPKPTEFYDLIVSLKK